MHKKIIAILAAILAVMVCVVTFDQFSGKQPTKSANGEPVVYSLDGENLTASQYYELLDKNVGDSVLVNAFHRAVLSNYPTTDEIKETASAQAAAVISNFSQQYPDNYKEVIGNVLRSSGYRGFDDLQEYLENTSKSNAMLDEYLTSHIDDLKIRKINYILIKFENIESGTDHSEPTLDEQNRMAAVDAMFEEGKEFEEVATTLSEDPSTAANGGYLGIIDKNTTDLDDAFTEAALALEDGAVSDWVFSENFGYFRIKNTGSTAAAFAEPEKTATEDESTPASPFQSLCDTWDAGVYDKMLWEKAEEYGVTFKDDATKNRIYRLLGLSDETVEESGEGE